MNRQKVGIKQAKEAAAQPARPVDVVDEIEYRIERQRSIAHMFEAIFELVQDQDRDDSNVDSLWSGMKVVAGIVDEDLERIHEDVIKLHEFTKGAAR